MERLLTPLLNRFLRKFVKSSQENDNDYGSFKASISGGGIALHNIELDLSSLLSSSSFEARRAFARSMEVKIPWTALQTQPIEITFDTVEIILSPASGSNTNPTNDDSAEPEEEESQPDADSNVQSHTGGSWLGTSSWLGSGLQSLAMRAGLNISFTINNILLKYIHIDGFVFTIALEKFDLATDKRTEWQELVDAPASWIKKDATIKGLSITLDPFASPAAAASIQSFLPLLRISSFRLSVLCPIFAFIEGVDIGKDVPKVSMAIEFGTVSTSINDQQVVWMQRAASLENRNNKGTEEKMAHVEEKQQKYSEFHENELRSLGFLGKFWFLLVDKAAYLQFLDTVNKESDDDPAVNPAVNPAIDTIPTPTKKVMVKQESMQNISSSAITMHAELSIFIAAMSLQLDKIVIDSIENLPALSPCFLLELGKTEYYSASKSTEMQEIDIQIQHFSMKHRSSYQSSTPQKAIWDEVVGIYGRTPAVLDGVVEAPDNAFSFLWSAGADDVHHDTTDYDVKNTRVCQLTAGQIWCIYNSCIMDDIRSILIVTPSKEGVEDNPTEDEGANSDQQWIQSYINHGIDIKVDALYLAMKSSSSLHAVALICSGFSYRYVPFVVNGRKDEASRKRRGSPPLCVSCTWTVVNGDWEVLHSRAGLSFLPNALPISNTMNILYSSDTNELSISDINLQLESNHVYSLCMALGLDERISEKGKNALQSVDISLSKGVTAVCCSSQGVKALSIPRCRGAVKMLRVNGNVPSVEMTSILDVYSLNYQVSETYTCISCDMASFDAVDVSRREALNSPVQHLSSESPLILITSFSRTTESDTGKSTIVLSSVSLCAMPGSLCRVVEFISSVQALSSSNDDNDDGSESASSVPCAGVDCNEASSGHNNNACVDSAFSVIVEMLSFTVFPGKDSSNSSHHEIPDGIIDDIGLSGFVSQVHWNSQINTKITNDVAVYCLEMALCRYSKHKAITLDENIVSVSNFGCLPAFSFSISQGNNNNNNNLASKREFSMNIGGVHFTCSPLVLQTLSLLHQQSTQNHQHENKNNTNPAEIIENPLPLLHGKIIFYQPVCLEAILDHNISSTTNTHNNDTRGGGIRCAIKEAFFLVHQESNDSANISKNNTETQLPTLASTTTTCDGSLVDLHVTVLHCRHDGRQDYFIENIITPMNSRVILRKWSSTERISVAFETDEVHVRVSKPMLDVVSVVSQGFSSSDQPARETDTETENEKRGNEESLLMTFSVSSERFIASFLPATLVMNEEREDEGDSSRVLAQISANDFAFAAHTWSTAMAIDIDMNACLTYADCAARQVVLMEYALLKASYTRRDNVQCGRETSTSHNINRKLPLVGTHVNVECESPLVVNINELALHDIKRAHAALTSDIGVPPPLRVINSSSFDFIIGQVDAAMQNMVSTGSTIDFFWLRDKPLSMRLACPPSVSTIGVDSALLLSWSEPIDAMAAGGILVPVKMADSKQCMIAIEVRRDGPVWRVEIHDGLCLTNHHASTITVLMGCDENKCVEIGGGQKQNLPLWSDANLRVMLGRGKWSQSIEIVNHSSGIEVLDVESEFSHAETDSFLDGSPLLANFRGSHQNFGALQLDIWPPIMLENQLPVPSIALCTLFNKETAPILLSMGSSVVIPVGVGGGEVMRLNAGNSLQPHALSIFCPPLVSSSVDDDGFIQSSQAGVEYIPAPGECTEIIIPAADGSPIPSLLVTEPFTNNSGPCLRLKLKARAIVESLLPVHIKLRLQGFSDSIDVPPTSKVALRVDISAITHASLGIAPSAGETVFTSNRFGLTSDKEFILPLPHEKNANQWITMAVALQGATDASKTTKLLFTPAHFISNQTKDNIHICPNPYDAHASIMSLTPSSTAPLLAIWNGVDSIASVHVAGEGDKPIWSDSVPLLQKKLDRQRIFIANNGLPKLLTYTTLLEEAGVLHLVFFDDPQPPYQIENNSDQLVEVEVSSTNMENPLLYTIRPSGSVDFSVPSDTPAADEEEDEQQQLLFPCIAPSDDAISLRLRAPNGVWSSPAAMAICDATCGEFAVHIKKRGRTLLASIAKRTLKGSTDSHLSSTTVYISEIAFNLLDDARGRHKSIPAGSKMLSISAKDLLYRNQKSVAGTACHTTAQYTIKYMECSAHVPSEVAVVSFLQDSAPLTIVVVHASSQVEDRPVDDGWIESISLSLPSLSVHLDDDSFQLITFCKDLLDIPERAVDSEEPDVLYSEVTEPRIFIGELSISDLRALVDLHLSVANTGLPMAIDTQRSPVKISGLRSENIFATHAVMFQGFKAHAVAESLLNAGSVLGSLQLLGNPTGLVRSIKRGVTDIMDNGLGAGSVTLVKEVSGWGVSSTVGFFNAFIGIRRKK